jgi:hypothetical protein
MYGMLHPPGSYEKTAETSARNRALPCGSGALTRQRSMRLGRSQSAPGGTKRVAEAHESSVRKPSARASSSIAEDAAQRCEPAEAEGPPSPPLAPPPTVVKPPTKRERSTPWMTQPPTVWSCLASAGSVLSTAVACFAAAADGGVPN